MVLQAVHIVISIFMMIGMGMLLYHLGWLKDEHEAMLSTLVTKVALPCMIINNLFTQFTRDSLISNAYIMLVPLLSQVAMFFISLLLIRALHIPRRRRGVFSSMFVFSNSVFIGMPVSLALFGEEALPYALLYYVVTTILLWTLGYGMMCRDGEQGERFSLKKLISIPLITFFACAVLVMLDVRMPLCVVDATRYMGNLVTPLSMFFSGQMLMRMFKRGAVRWEKGYTMVLIGRFLAAPAILLLTGLVIPMTPLMRNALLIQAAMPVMAQTPIIAASVGVDAEYAVGGIAVSTLGSLIAIPAYMAIIPYL